MLFPNLEYALMHFLKSFLTIACLGWVVIISFLEMNAFSSEAKSAPVLPIPKMNPVTDLCGIPIEYTLIRYQGEPENSTQPFDSINAKKTRYNIYSENPNFVGVLQVFYLESDITEYILNSDFLNQLKPQKEWKTELKNASPFGELVTNIFWDPPVMVISKGAVM